MLTAHQRQRGDGSDPVGGQQHQAEQGERRCAGGRVVPGHRSGGGEGAGPGQQPIGHRGGDHPAGGQGQGEAQQQPAHRVAGPPAGQHRPDGGRAQHRQHGANQGPAAELGQVGPAGPDRQAIHPGHHGQAEHGQRPQHPRQPGQPTARPAQPGSRRHRRGPGCPQRTTGPATSQPRLSPTNVDGSRLGIVTDGGRRRLARGSYERIARQPMLALPSDILSDAL